jgi:hypothetical protein
LDIGIVVNLSNGAFTSFFGMFFVLIGKGQEIKQIRIAKIVN